MMMMMKDILQVGSECVLIVVSSTLSYDRWFGGNCVAFGMHVGGRLVKG
jgi:hypothetical protein